jgi:CRISPR type III-B/RAMP module RAMP protein Cmr1
MKTYNLKFITPAFLCGANQSNAELRAPSVRGALRWWFRVLGGTREEEAHVFGGVHGGAQKSKVVVRCEVREMGTQPFPEPTDPRSESNLYYLGYFAKALNDKKTGERKPSRFSAGANIPMGTVFEIQIGASGLEPQLQQKLDQAIDFFVHLGSLGLRATRGFGAFAEEKEEKLPTRSEFAQWVKGNAADTKVMVRLTNDEVYSDAKKAMSALGGWLRAIRKETHCDGKHESAFGYSKDRERMSSALKLRPVQVEGGFLPVVVYTDEACSRGSQADAVERASVAL